MPAFALLLRAVNVGGRNKVPMAGLRALLEREGCAKVGTVLQSGNAVFESAARTASALEGRLERAIAGTLKVECDCFVRSAREWGTLVGANPFPGEAQRDPAHLLVVVLKAAPVAGGVAGLRAAIRGRETIAIAGRDLYAFYPDGIGRSKLTLPLIEKHLGTHGTGRNWNTILKVAELLGR